MRILNTIKTLVPIKSEGQTWKREAQQKQTMKKSRVLSSSTISGPRELRAGITHLVPSV